VSRACSQSTQLADSNGCIHIRVYGRGVSRYWGPGGRARVAVRSSRRSAGIRHVVTLQIASGPRRSLAVGLGTKTEKKRKKKTAADFSDPLRRACSMPARGRVARPATCPFTGRTLPTAAGGGGGGGECGPKTDVSVRRAGVRGATAVDVIRSLCGAGRPSTVADGHRSVTTKTRERQRRESDRFPFSNKFDRRNVYASVRPTDDGRGGGAADCERVSGRLAAGARGR
jgi:hypothetical protein